MSRVNCPVRPRHFALFTMLLLVPTGCAEGVDMGRGGHGVFLHHDRAIEGQYIVKIDETAMQMRRSESDPGRVIAAELAEEVGGRILDTLDGKDGVFAIELSEEGAEELSWDRRVAYVETDAETMAFGSQEPPPSWGLDRIDQRELPLDDAYNFEGKGSGVNVYVIDSGIRTSHGNFEGRATEGFSSVFDGRGAGDCNGHGTHVAGTIGGSRVGVAKGANLISVRVLGCDGTGSTADHIAGVQWVIANAKAPAVINASVGGPSSPALVEAYEKAAEAGITVVVAAGNDAKDACDVSPANAPSSLTVGATDRNDAFAGFSNTGACVDVLAPGVDIISAWHTGDEDGRSQNGTSMASPHVAGVAALLLGESPEMSPEKLRTAILESATAGAISGVPADTPNLLLFSNAEQTAPEAPVDPEEPAGPEEPASPEDPAGPEEPTDPEEPTEPVDPGPSDCLSACTQAQNTCTGTALGLDCDQLCGAGVGDAACFAGVTACVQMASCL